MTNSWFTIWHLTPLDKLAWYWLLKTNPINFGNASSAVSSLMLVVHCGVTWFDNDLKHCHTFITDRHVPLRMNCNHTDQLRFVSVPQMIFSSPNKSLQNWWHFHQLYFVIVLISKYFHDNTQNYNAENCWMSELLAWLWTLVIWWCNTLSLCN